MIPCYITWVFHSLWSGWKRTGLLLAARQSCSSQLPSCQNSHRGPGKLLAAKQSCFKLHTAGPGPVSWRMLLVPLRTRQGECSRSSALAPWRLCISAKGFLWRIKKSRALKKRLSKRYLPFVPKKGERIQNKSKDFQVNHVNWSCI